MKNELKKSFPINLLEEEIMNQVMFWKAMLSLLFGCVISTIVQAEVTSKEGV